MRTCWCWPLMLLVVTMLARPAYAGGSGLNVVVVVNQNSSNSIALGNYYIEKRQVPPENVLRINWTGGNVEWPLSDLNTYLLDPLLSMLSTRRLTNQIDVVVLSMDIPYRVVRIGTPQESGYNSTTSVLYYGFKADGPTKPGQMSSCNLPDASTNSYAGSEDLFRSSPPNSATATPFLTMMLTAADLGSAKGIVDQGVAGDGMFPPQIIYLAKSEDRLRNVRFYLFDNAVFNARLLGRASIELTNSVGPTQLGYILGYQGGQAIYAGAQGVFAPGAMADQLTSYGGDIFESVGQTSLLTLLESGASGSYGTVVEPCAYFEKFPSPQNYFFQSRGFNLAECYYQSITNPYQGLLVGEPLSAPFALPCSGEWMNLPTNAVLSGTTNLSLQFTAVSSMQPLQKVDLFVDGRFFKTLTNIGPNPNNTISVGVNGLHVDYTVPVGASLKGVASGLANALNNAAQSRGDIEAFAHGDRLELQSTNQSGSGMQLSSSSSAGGAGGLTTYISTSGSNFLDTRAYGLRSYAISNLSVAGDYLKLFVVMTNGQAISIAVTNGSSTNTLADLGKALRDAVNSNPELQGPDGIIVEDVNMHEEYPYNVYVYGTNDHSGEFNIRARSVGFSQAQVQVSLTGSRFIIKPAGTNWLDQNLNDLQPRAHLYLATGSHTLPLTMALDSSLLADGFHELTAVAYEGTHVHTQKRIPTQVIVKNTSLEAAMEKQFAGAEVAVSSTLNFKVTSSGAAVSRIELYGTGGLLDSVTNQASAMFSVPGPMLGAGLHPFYAIVTANGGPQYRTQTEWVRLGEAAASFRLTFTSPPPTVSWPAVPGKNYEILTASGLAGPWGVAGNVTATGSIAVWTDTSASGGQRYYRVRAVN